MLRNKWIWILVIALVVGGIGGVLFNRFVIPWLASMPGLSGLHKLESSNPVIINRREEVQINEGANYLDLSKQAAAFTVTIYSQSGASFRFLGNGIIASSDGMILTSRANLGAPGSLVVVTNDGTSFPGTLRALDPRSELAVLTISANNLPFAQFADAWDLQAAQKLIYVGRSNKEFTRQFGLGQVTQSVDNASSLDRVFYTEAFENTIASDAKITSDYIGGPIINLNGKVVGMTSSSLGVLISEDLSTAVSSYFQNGKIQRPQFGAKNLNLSTPLAKLKNLSRGGMLVVSVDDGSPAKLAGLATNDLIISVDNQPLPQSNFEKIINQHGFNDMPITVLRNGTEVNLTIKLQPK
ncbi:MAG: S1C family serine protease [Candidatus Doudnabacteria bacterium]|nr:S1C family serine protease [Candidatus Doudnabacteria bacterium]